MERPDTGDSHDTSMEPLNAPNIAHLRAMPSELSSSLYQSSLSHDLFSKEAATMGAV